MKVLVTGGMGFVGREVVSLLAAQGELPVLLARNPAAAAEVFPGLAVCRGDILDPDALATAVRGVEAVIHLVGIISETGRATFENVHTQGTRNVVAAARGGGARRFIHMSALGTRPSAVSRYHQSKWEAEEAVRTSGLQSTIFRPSLIFGPRDHFVNLFARMMRWSPAVPVMGRAEARFQPVDVATVAAAFVRSLRTPSAVGQTFDLCGPDTLTMAEILGVIAQVTGRRRWFLKVPAPLAWLQASLLEGLFAVVRKPPPLNRDQLVMLQEDNVGNMVPAREVFGLQPVGFRAGVAAYLTPAADGRAYRS